MTQQMKVEKVRGDEKARRGKLEKQILLKRLFWLSLIYTRQHPTTNITNVVTITNEKKENFPRGEKVNHSRNAFSKNTKNE